MNRGLQTTRAVAETGLAVVPVNRDQAFAFIDAVHRHHDRPAGYRFAVGAALDGRLVGVATAGRPVARALDDGWTIEVTRVATDGTRNACSLLYGACWRMARAGGYRRAVTYTQAGESGASLRAAGWRLVAELRARGGWNMPGRPRAEKATGGVARYRWEITAPNYQAGEPLPELSFPLPEAPASLFDCCEAS
jgi:hypothetical protein